MNIRPMVRGSVVPLIALAFATTGCSEPNSGAGTTAAEVSGSPTPEQPAAAPDPRAGPSDPALPERTFCNIESVDGQVFGSELAVEEGAEIRGWLGHDEPAEIENSELVVIREDGDVATRLPLQRDGARDDVVAAYAGREDLRNSGFSVSWVPGDIHPGRYHVLLEYKAGGVAFRCDNGRYVRTD